MSNNPIPQTVITIPAMTIVKIAAIGVLLFLLFYLRDLVLILLASVVLASSVEPLTLGLMRYRLPRLASVLLIYIAVAIGFVGLLYFFLPVLVIELRDLSTILPQQLESLNLIMTSEGPLAVITGNFDLSTERLAVALQDWISTVPTGVLDIAGAVFGGFFSFTLILVISFYLAVQERGIENFLRIIIPVSYESYVIDLWRRTQRKIGLWMQGQLLLGLIVGVIVYLGLTLFGVRHALLLAIVAAVFELIPFFGPVLSAIPGIGLAFTDNVTTGILVTGLYLMIQQFENNLIYPLVVKKMVGVPALMVIIALIVGGRLAGFLGILLAVPVATLAMEFLTDLEREKLKQLAAKEAAASGT